MAATDTWTEWQDAIVKKIYASQSYAERRRLYKTYQPKLAPHARNAIYQRAITLGLLKPLRREPRWCDAEIAIVEKYARYSDVCIQRHLKKAGFQRTVNAVHIYRLRHVVGVRQGKIDSGIYTACRAAEIIGSSSRTLTHWIEKGWLPAKRGTHHGPVVMWEIKAKDLRNFVIDHIGYCDLSRVDKFAFIDLLCPEHGMKASSKEATA